MRDGRRQPDEAGTPRLEDKPWHPLVWYLAMLIIVLPSLAAGAGEMVQRFPAPDFESGYTLPTTETPTVDRPVWRERLDVVIWAAFLGAAVVIVHRYRSRRAMFWLAIVALLYFGFYRKGCICPVGSTQNVACAAGGNGYALPWTVAAYFALPLLAAIFFGRVFCAGVCPLGAIQDLVLWRPVTVPAWLEVPLGLLAWTYLGLGVLFAAVGSDFFICRYDPFVGFFRMSGPAHMILAGSIILGLCVFVGRVYCRFLCPYGVLLRLASVFAWKSVSITPRDCVDCRLCEASCPFGAIRGPAPASAVGHPRRRAVLLLALVPVLVAGLAVLGYFASGTLARMDRAVVLADLLRLEQAGKAPEANDDLRAFHLAGHSADEALAEGAAIERRYAVGTPLFGAWMGLAIGGSLIALLRPRTAGGYEANARACVACARCYASCPVPSPGAAAGLPAGTAVGGAS